MTAKKTPTDRDMLARLQEPFPTDQIKTKPQAGKQLPYAEVWSYQQRLDEVFGFGWTAVTVRLDGGDCLCTVTVTLADGSQISREAYGEKNSSFGGAEAQAFKRACSAFGIGRYLYALDSPPASHSKPSQHRNGRTPAPARGGQAKSTKDIATAAMLKRIDALSKAVFGPALWEANRNKAIESRTDGRRPLTKAEAQEMIANLERLDSQPEEVEFQ